MVTRHGWAGPGEGRGRGPSGGEGGGKVTELGDRGGEQPEAEEEHEVPDEPQEPCAHRVGVLRRLRATGRPGRVPRRGQGGTGRVGGMLACRFARLRPLAAGGAGSGRCGEVATLGRCREVCDALHAACTSNMASAESVPSESMLRSSPACKAEPRHAIASPCVGTAHKAQPLQCTSLELPS
jgi:hypothetical protein